MGNESGADYLDPARDDCPLFLSSFSNFTRPLITIRNRQRLNSVEQATT